MPEKWRMVTGSTGPADWASGYIPSFLRAIAEGVIDRTSVCLRIEKPGVLLQRYCDVLRDINYEACVENNVKITRSMVAGGGVVYGEPGTSKKRESTRRA